MEARRDGYGDNTFPPLLKATNKLMLEWLVVLVVNPDEASSP